MKACVAQLARNCSKRGGSAWFGHLSSGLMGNYRGFHGKINLNIPLRMGLMGIYPLVNVYITVVNHHFSMGKSTISCHFQ